MKKIMFFAAMMVATLSANAQNEVGQVTLKPTVGMNIASMTKADNSKVRPGIVAGIEAEFGVAENFAITAGVLYSQQGVKGKDEVKVDISDLGLGVGILDLQGKLTYKLDYINIPILAQFYPVKGLALKAGIQPGFCVTKKVKIDGTASVGPGLTEPFTEDVKLGDAVKDFAFAIPVGVKDFAFAIPVGVSYEYESFVVDARYNIGVTKALKDADSRHSVFSITLGYKFAL